MNGVDFLWIVGVTAALCFAYDYGGVIGIVAAGVIGAVIFYRLGNRARRINDARSSR